MMGMPGFPWVRVAGGFAGLAAVTALLWLANDRFHQKRAADDARACAAAVAHPAQPIEPCLPAVRATILAARAAASCDTGLMGGLTPQNRFTIRQSCGAGAKRLVAELEAARADLASATAQLADARADTLAAIARAESRATQRQERDAHAGSIIAAAPRTAAGGIACDAECLRQLGR